MKKAVIIALVIFLKISLTYAQKESYLLKGSIIDSNNRNTVAGAIIIIKNYKPATSNEEGGFRISLEKGIHTLDVKYPGFKEFKRKIEIKRNTEITIYLQEDNLLKEIEVIDKKADENVREAKVGEEIIKAEELEKIPQLLGEKDILKSIQILPGVQSADASGNSVYIRGSNLGQNLLIYDEAIIYNPSHLLGFFSIFNPDAVDEIKLIKSGMPANYGNRIASVIEVKSAKANSNQTVLKGGIGLLSSRLTLETPVISNKCNIIISGRRTYFDLLSSGIKTFTKEEENEFSAFFNNTKYYFYDLNLKANWIIGKKNIITLSGYKGEDIYHYDYNETDYTGIKWGNQLLSLKWLHQNNSNTYLENIIYFSDYKFGFDTKQNTYKLGLKSGATDIAYKGIYNKQTQFFDTKIKAGGELIMHNFIPTLINANAFGVDLKFDTQSKLYMSKNNLTSCLIIS